MNSFRLKAILMLVIFLVIAPSTIAIDISTVKSEPTEDVKEIIQHEGDTREPLTPIISDLIITPAEVELGDEVNVTFVVTNIDSRSCVFVPFVKIGKIMIMYRIELEGYESNVVEYIMNQDTAGEFEVEVDGLTGSFTVKPKPSFWDKIPGFSYESIILGLISVIIILWYARARNL